MIQTSPYHTRADVWTDCNNKIRLYQDITW
nr:MAG TPA: hypothetical protein [Caudoviricetes sp.]